MSLLAELDAFYTEHRRCGELEAGVSMGRPSGLPATAVLPWPVGRTRPTMPAAIELLT